MGSDKNPDCTLRNKASDAICKDCSRCGWNKLEIERRKMLRKQKGLTRHGDLWRLELPDVYGRRIQNAKRDPVAAIREHCAACIGPDTTPAQCQDKDCPLWPFRAGEEGEKP